MEKRPSKNLKLNNRNGYTLAEVIITLALVAILLCLSIVGLVYYFNSLKQIEMDGTARQIYIAAQNHLSQMEASGKLEKDEYKSYATDASNQVSINGKNYVSVEYNNASKGNLTSSILADMLPMGSIDETVRTEGSYVIEYDPETATVYDVFYSDNISNVNFNAAEALRDSGGTADTEEARALRRDFIFPSGNAFVIGYYGGECLEKISGQVLEAPKAEVINKEKLQIKITDSNYFKRDSNNYQYKSSIQVTVKGQESGAERKISLPLSDFGEVTFPEKDVSSADAELWDVKTEGLLPEKKLVYTLTLDSMEKGMHFKDICKDMIPGENISVTVSCQSNYVLAVPVQETVITNSLFGSKTDIDPDDAKKGSRVTVEYVRHLENLDGGKNSDIKKYPDTSASRIPTATSYTTLSNKKYTITRLVKEVSQTKDIDFDYFREIYPDSDKVRFTAIENIQIALYEGNNFTINDMEVLEKYSYGAAGLFVKSGNDNGNYQELEVCNLTFISPKIHTDGTSQSVGTVIGYISDNAQAVVKNVISVNPEIYSNWYSGGLIGSTGGSMKSLKMEDCAVLKDPEKETGSATVSGNACTGGMVGILRGGTVSIKDSFTAGVLVTVTSGNKQPSEKRHAGGFVGAIDGGTVTISNCYAGGLTNEGRYSSEDYNVTSYMGNAGGFIGWNNKNTTFKDCYSSCSAYAKTAAGGFVGEEISSGSKYENCYSVGLVKGASKAGAFAATMSTSTGNIKNCRYLENLNFKDTAKTQPMGAISSGAKSNVTATKFSDFAETGTHRQTYTYDSTLKEESYPFTMVTSLRPLANATADKVHYGDWENVNESDESSDYVFGYTELSASDEPERWYIVSAEAPDGSRNVKTSVLVDDLKDNGKSVTADKYKYCIFAKKNINSLFTQNGTDDGLKAFLGGNKKDGTKTIDNTEYDYYFIESSNLPNTDSSSGIVTLPPYNGTDIQFCFNPDFAAAITIADKADDLGKSIPYQIRTQQQLKNINNRSSYMEKSYEQTCRIDLNSGDDFAAIGQVDGESTTKPFKGTYSARYKSENSGYEIRNFNQSLSESGERAGLFADIEGRVEYVNLRTSGTGKIRATAPLSNIGGIAAKVGQEGKLSYCNSNVPIEVNCKTGITSTISVGGLIGENAGSIEMCSSRGKIIVAADNAKPMDIGGFIGLCHSTGKVSQCWSYMTEIDSSDAAANTGGFIGHLNNNMKDSLNVADCYSVSYIRKSDTDLYNTGAFIGKDNPEVAGTSSKVIRCHGAFIDSNGFLDDTNNYNFIGLSDSGDKTYANIYSQCYYLTENHLGTINGVTYLTKENYKVLNMFTGFKMDIWQIVDKGYYPSLIKNAE